MSYTISCSIPLAAQPLLSLRELHVSYFKRSVAGFSQSLTELTQVVNDRSICDNLVNSHPKSSVDNFNTDNRRRRQIHQNHSSLYK